MKLFKWLSRNVFNIVGGLIFGLSIPTLGMDSITLIFNPILDFMILGSIGILFVGISYYYMFIDKGR